MVKPNFDYSKIDNSSKLKRQIELVLSQAESKLKLITVSYFVLGFLIAPINNTWLESLIIGGINITFFFLSQRKQNSELSRTYFSFGLAFFCIQFIYQAKGSVFFHIFFFNSMFLLIMLQNKRYFFTYLITLVIFYAILVFSVLSNNILEEYLISLDFDSNLNYFLLLASIIQAISFSYIISSYVKTNILNSLKQATYIEEKLNVNSNTELALHIAEGNLETDYELQTNDVLGEALIKMRASLKELRERDRIQKWNNTGIASISELLLTETNLERLTSKTLRELIRHLKSHQGAIYITQKNGNSDVLHLVSSYAGNKRQKINDIFLNEGEGLIGEVYRRQEPLEITDIPSSYEFIKSGLGEAKPKAILIVPLNVKSKTIGVIEIASFNSFTTNEKHFLINVSENIAVAISSVVTAQETQKLLDEAQRFNEQISSQEKLMQQTIGKMSTLKEQAEFYQKRFNQYMFIVNSVSQMEKAFFYHVNLESNQVIFLSESFESITGFSIEDFSGENSKTLLDIIHTDSKDTFELNNFKISDINKRDYQIVDSQDTTMSVEETFLILEKNLVKELIGIVKLL